MQRAIELFWKCFERLPKPMRELSNRNFRLLRSDLWHSSLHFKKVGSFWSVRIGLHHRALSVEDGQDFIWVWIGSHGA
ncbi:MAG: hypothetical protein Q7O66_13995, partial [Dehalococcoidia bacterium]|nr:hypothetical protein [Dehalococcoidia bacterium]